MRPRAFTLVEVLVVAALTATLAAMLFPVFARAKLPASGTVCLSNLHSVGVAVSLYTADADGRYPRAYDPEALHDAHPEARKSGPLLADVLMPYTKSRAVWRCPLDRGVPRLTPEEMEPGPELIELTLPGTEPTVFSKYGMSYGYFSPLWEYGLTDPPTMWDPDRNVERGPTEVPVAEDLYGAWHGSRAARRFNVVYADGHVRATPWPNVVWPGSWVPVESPR